MKTYSDIKKNIWNVMLCISPGIPAWNYNEIIYDETHMKSPAKKRLPSYIFAFKIRPSACVGAGVLPLLFS